MRTKPRPEKGPGLEAQDSITFDQAVSGAQVPLQVPMHASCPTCRGTGAKPGTTPIVCPSCEGRGIETQGQGMFSISQPCSRCGGAGTVIEDPCPTCKGSGAVRTVKKLRVNIPAGVRDGSRIRLAGKGEPGRNGGPPGDLYLITKVGSSPLFKRKGDNLEVEVPLSIPEALRGRRRAGADPERDQDAARAPGHGPAAPSSVCAARARRSSAHGGAGERRHPLPLRDRRARSPQRGAAAGRRGASRTLGGDPRAGLFGNGAAGASRARRRRGGRR